MLVSVIMPTYNCGKFILQSLDSVIAQTVTDWEVQIVDDCSTDNTAEVLKPQCDSHAAAMSYTVAVDLHYAHSLIPLRKFLSLFLMTPSSRHGNPGVYARNHSYRYGSPCVYSRQHRAFSLGDLVFMPDSISMTGLKVLMILSSKPLVYS